MSFLNGGECGCVTHRTICWHHPSPGLNIIWINYPPPVTLKINEMARLDRLIHGDDDDDDDDGDDVDLSSNYAYHECAYGEKFALVLQNYEREL